MTVTPNVANIRIRGGPTGKDLKIEDIETGRRLPVLDLKLTATPTDFLTATITVLVSEMDVQVEAAEVGEVTL